MIELQNIAVGFDESKPLIQQINRSWEIGNLVMLMGHNGSGKSTLLKTIAGRLPKLAGEAIINGINVHRTESKQIASEVTLSGRFSDQSPAFSVQEYIGLGLYRKSNWWNRLSNDHHKTINRVADQCQLSHLIDRKITELSDGERQRVQMAQVIALDTPILLLDEPFAHLDIKGKFAIAELLKSLSKDENKLVVVSTHSLDLALEFGDVVELIKADRLESYSPSTTSKDEILEYLKL